MSERVQKMARINVADDAWTALRVQTLREGTTLADRIGDLIERAVTYGADIPPEPATTTTPRPKRAGFPKLRTPSEPATSTPPPPPGGHWVPPWEE